jgi:hypothetical protein
MLHVAEEEKAEKQKRKEKTTKKESKKRSMLSIGELNPGLQRDKLAY